VKTQCAHKYTRPDGTVQCTFVLVVDNDPVRWAVENCQGNEGEQHEHVTWGKAKRGMWVDGLTLEIVE
jgi:hypothetical protein